MTNNITLFNHFFSNQHDVNLIENFHFHENYYLGQIQVGIFESQLIFDVKIPDYFPFSQNGFCIKFFNHELAGYPHFTEYLCLHTESTINPQTKLFFELEGLKKWIKKYYIDKEVDENILFPLVPSVKINTNTPIQYFLFNDFEHNFKKYDFGTFTYSQVGLNTFIVKKLDHKKFIFTLYYSHTLNNYPNSIGIWIFIEDFPVDSKRNIVSNWIQLEQYIDYQNKQFIYNSINLYQKNKIIYIPFLIGYKLIKESNPFTHWEIIYINVNDLSIIMEYNKKNRTNNFRCIDKQILWQKTSNCSYDRFFGRGKFSESFANKKILLIGIGAIGSSLAKSLVKCGIKNLDLYDLDIVEQGNICRSEYSINQIGTPKFLAFSQYLMSISPYVNIDICLIEKYPAGTEKYENYKQKLYKYEIIFDCTTDNELALLLDSMDLRSQIINLSITNEAKELLVISGKNIMESKSHIVKHFGSQKADFYEGIGCHYPTFKASYIDINMKLQFAIKSIVNQIESTEKCNSFIVKSKNESTLSKFEIFQYFQRDLCLYLLVNEEVLEKVKELSYNQYPNEFGGILLGSYFDDNKSLYIADIYVSSDYENTKNSFKRLVNDINAFISDKFEETEGISIYIGEWHSHPDSSSQYSVKDFESMKEIATNSNVQIKNPVLLINALNRINNNYAFYIFKNNEMYQYEKI